MLVAKCGARFGLAGRWNRCLPLLEIELTNLASCRLKWSEEVLDSVTSIAEESIEPFSADSGRRAIHHARRRTSDSLNAIERCCER